MSCCVAFDRFCRADSQENCIIRLILEKMALGLLWLAAVAGTMAGFLYVLSAQIIPPSPVTETGRWLELLPLIRDILVQLF